jgi:hypothetical protein
VAFAPSSSSEPPTAGRTPRIDRLPDLFAKRTAEIRSLVAPGPDGSPQMRPDARAAVSDNLAAIRAHHPELADQLEEIAARRVEFLASKIPHQPDFGVVQTGPDRWRPSDMEMRTFARYVDAVEDPGGVEERLAHGTLTPEDVEAYHKVYPERAAHFTEQLITGLQDRDTPVPYSRRITLSMFGIPADPAMTPRILSELQGHFAKEPGTDGGMSAPKAQPAFGSLKKSPGEPTPAQRGRGA